MKKEQPHQDEARYKGYLKAEQEAVALYSALAEAEQDPRRARVFRQLVEAEERHVTHWTEKLGMATDDLSRYRPKFQIRFLGWLARQFGTQMVLPVVLRIESADTAMYQDEPEAQSILVEEEGHSQTLEDLKEGRYPGGELDRGGWRQTAAGAPRCHAPQTVKAYLRLKSVGAADHRVTQLVHEDRYQHEHDPE